MDSVLTLTLGVKWDIASSSGSATEFCYFLKPIIVCFQFCMQFHPGYVSMDAFVTTRLRTEPISTIAVIRT